MSRTLKNKLKRCAVILRDIHRASYNLDFDSVRTGLTELNSQLPNSYYIKNAEAPFVFDKETEPYFRYHVKQAFNHLKQAYILLRESEDYPRDTFAEWLSKVEPELGKGLEKAAMKYENKDSTIKISTYTNPRGLKKKLVKEARFKSIKEASSYLDTQYPDAKLIDFQHDNVGFKKAYKYGSKLITLEEDYLDGKKTASPVEEPCKIKVTTINGRFHVRLFVNGHLFSEMSSDDRRDISPMSKDQLRWVSKLGIDSPMAEASRARNKNWNFFGNVKQEVKPGGTFNCK